MDLRNNNVNQDSQALTHQLEQLHHELELLKQELNTEKKARQDLENFVANKQAQWQLEKQHNPVAILIWENKDKSLILKEYNEIAQSILPDQLESKIGENLETIFADQPEIIESIYQCLKQQKVINYQQEISEKYLNFKCVFLPPAQVILYYQLPHLCLGIEKKLKSQIEQESVISLFGKKALTLMEISDLMIETVTLVSQSLNVKFCRILELLPNGSAFLMKAGIGWPEDLIGTATFSFSLNSQAGFVLSRQTPLFIEDHRIDPHFKGDPLLHNHRIVSSATVIITDAEQPYGVLEVHSDQLRQFTEDDLHFLQAIANILAIAIERYKQREQLNLLERAINVSSNSIFMVDALSESHPITYVNSGFERLTGYSKEQILNQSYTILNQDESDQEIMQEIQKAMIEGKEYSTTMRTYREDNTVFWNEFYLSPIHNLQGHLTHFIGVQTDITERKCIEESLQMTQFCLDRAKDAVFWLHSSGYFIYVNDAACELLGYSKQELLILKSSKIGIYSPCESTLDPIASKHSLTFETQHTRKDGSILPVEISVNYLEFNDQKYNCAFVRDISERKKAELSLRESEEQFRRTFELAPIGMAITALNGQYEKVNKALCKALNYSKQELLEQNVTELDLTHPADISVDLALNKRLLKGEISHFQREKRYLAKDGRVVNVLLQVVLVQDTQGKPLHVVRQIVDITQRKKMEERLLHTASHDILTGLPNRMLFIDRLQQLLRRKKENPNLLFAVLFLDLDRFKMVNDSMGHSIGDKLLIAIARKLLTCVHTEDLVARFGGDEFTIILSQINSKEEVNAIAEKIHQSLKNPIAIEGYEIFTSTSIGIAMSDSHYEKPEEMLRDADLTMYHAKETGRSRHEIFDQTMYQQIRSRLELETDLRKAIQQQEFFLNYQPILDLKTQDLVGFEALIRWINPHRGFISPMQFIPIAEETGLIVAIGEWVLEEACRQMNQWQDQFPQSKKLTISVNLSGRQIKETQLIDKIDQILNKTALESSRLKLEITESILMENMEETTQLFQELKNRQIKLSMDDFGTGYSSLSYLHRFQMNTLKIDRAFVNPIENDSEKHYEIIKAIISLAHAFKMDIVAEGIETETQVQKLRHLGCEYGQGYFFAKPLSAQEIEQKYFS